MSLRMRTFVCEAGHRFETVAEADATSDRCKCGATASVQRRVEAPALRGISGITKGEVKQYLTQFGEVDPKTGKYKFIPKNRSELNIELKQRGVSAISEREFNDQIDKQKGQREAALMEKPSAAVESKTLEVMKARREWFRTAHDNGLRPGGDDSEFWKSQGITPPAPADAPAMSKEAITSEVATTPAGE